MNQEQCNIVIECQEKLIESLTPAQKDEWFSKGEEHFDGDIVDGLMSLIEFID